VSNYLCFLDIVDVVVDVVVWSCANILAFIKCKLHCQTHLPKFHVDVALPCKLGCQTQCVRKSVLQKNPNPPCYFECTKFHADVALPCKLGCQMQCVRWSVGPIMQKKSKICLGMLFLVHEVSCRRCPSLQVRLPNAVRAMER